MSATSNSIDEFNSIEECISYYKEIINEKDINNEATILSLKNTINNYQFSFDTYKNTINRDNSKFISIFVLFFVLYYFIISFIELFIRKYYISIPN